jgi:peptidyl-prolyl cis-trans isomerase D
MGEGLGSLSLQIYLKPPKKSMKALHLLALSIIFLCFKPQEYWFRRLFRRMPIMTRMRDSMPVILFGLLIAFLITIIFEWGMDYLGLRSGRQELLGKINGRKVTYQEFAELVKSYTDQQKAQTGREADEQQLVQIRDQVWQSLVTQQIVEGEIHRLGLKVSDGEIIDWVRGDNPPDDLRRFFVDSTGQFKRDVYEQFLNDPNRFIRDPNGNDPNYGTRWLADYEKNLRQRRLQEKLQSLLTATVRVGEEEVRQRFVDQNVRYTVRYAAFDANLLVKDEDVQVTDADLKTYYDEHLDQYKTEATRKLKFVMFSDAPSAADSAGRQKEIQDVAAKAHAGQDFLQLVYTYSDRPDSGAFFRHGELTPVLEKAVFAARPGDIVGPLLDANGWRLVKVLDQRKSAGEYVLARHILFPLQGDTNAVKAEAQSVALQARSGRDFSALARQYSKDPGSAAQGGELPWFGKGAMVAPFEQAAFKAKVGEVVGPVRTQFGLHLIKVEARDNRELKLATITTKLESSPQTRNDMYERARDFAYNARESEFTREAQQLNFEVREAQVQDKSGFIPGVGINEAVTRWAFSEKVGSVSEPYTVPNGNAVFTIVERKDAGIKSFDEVKESIRPFVLREKKLEKAMKIASDVRAKLTPADSLVSAQHIVSGVTITETGPFTLGAMSVPSLGREPRFVGATSSLKAGEITGPVEGVRGAYLLQLVSKTDFDTSAYAAQHDLLASRILQEKRGKFIADWLQQLKEKADIEDHRDLFYR